MGRLYISLDVCLIINLKAESGALTEPLWDVATVPHPYPNNAVFVREYTIKLLSSSFPNMTAAEVSRKTKTSFILFLLLSQSLLILNNHLIYIQVTQFVNRLYESRNDPSEFKKNIRDFLVQSKEFSAQVTINSSLTNLFIQLLLRNRN